MRTFTVEASEALEDELVALLWMHGGLGSWSEGAGAGRVRIHGFVRDDCAELRLAKALKIDPDVLVSPLEAVADRDWAASWRRASGPIEVGRSFLVDPREPAEAEPPFSAGGRCLLRLPARTAFGLGSHESTRLAVELLERADVAGRRVLDVGTGSGILAFAALALGARSVVALDVDPAAALLLPAYAALNREATGGRAPGAYVGPLAALAESARFECALVNVVPAEIAGDLARLATLLEPRGVAIFSGILAAEAARATSALARHGFVETDRRTDGEWIAFATRRAEVAP